MKRFLAVLVAFAVAALPVPASAFVPVPIPPLVYDDGDFESSIELALPDDTYTPPAIVAPVVEFVAPGPGVYAMDSLSFLLRQGPEPVLETEAGGPPPTVLAIEATEIYPVTVQIWNLAPGSTSDYVPGAAVDAEITVGDKGWYELFLTEEKLVFTGAVRVGIYLRPPSSAPALPLNLGVDTDGTDSTHETGLSLIYDATATPPWGTVDPPANFGIRATVHFVPTLTCQGFLPPFDKTIVMKRGGRNIPLKALLFDAEGAPVTRSMLVAPPVVAMYEGDTDETMAQVAPPGKSNSGQTFRSLGGGKWRYNLKTKKNLGAGIHTVQMVSGDVTEYVIDPTCMGDIEVLQGEKTKPAPKGKKK